MIYATLKTTCLGVARMPWPLLWLQLLGLPPKTDYVRAIYSTENVLKAVAFTIYPKTLERPGQGRDFRDVTCLIG